MPSESVAIYILDIIQQPAQTPDGQQCMDALQLTTLFSSYANTKGSHYSTPSNVYIHSLGLSSMVNLSGVALANRKANWLGIRNP